MASPSQPATGGSGLRVQAWLTLPLFAYGLLCLGGGLVWLALQPGLLTGPFYRPQVIGFAHLVGLGWLASLVIGSAYQLVPVALESPLWSPLLARLHAVLHLVGVPGMAHALARQDFARAGLWSALVLTGLVLFILNLTITANRKSRWTPTSVGVVSGLFWLMAAGAVGLYMIAVRLFPGGGIPPMSLLGLHTHLMVVGFFLQVLLAVTYTLLPMFTLGTLASRLRAWASLAALNAGLFLLAPALLGWAFLLPVAASLVLFGVVIFLWEVSAIVARRKRPLDVPLKFFLAALAFVLAAAAAGLAEALQVAGLSSLAPLGDRLCVVFFVVTAFGALTLSVLGMGAKILPFLVWQVRYAALVGRWRVPKVVALLHESRLRVTALLGPLAAVVLCAGTLLSSPLTVRISALLYLSGLLAYAAALAPALSHLRKARLEPLFPAGPNQGKGPVSTL